MTAAPPSREALRPDQVAREVTLPNGRFRIERRDLLGRLRRVEEPDGSWLGYRYDLGGRLTGVAHSSGERVDFTRSEHELCAVTARTKTTLHLSADGVPVELSLEVDGRRWSVACRRDARGAITAVRYPGSEVFTSLNELLRFEASPDRATVRFPSGASTSEHFRETALAAIVIGDRSFDLHRDAEGRIVRVADTPASYDAQGRLAAWGPRAYCYDAEGRLLCAGDASFEYSGPTVARAGNVAFAYDELGRRVARHDAHGTTRYGYSLFGQLTRVELSDGQSLDYVYDGFGRLVARTLDGETRYFVPGFDGRRLAEADATGRIVCSYLWSGLQCLARVDGAAPGPVRESYHRVHGARLAAIGDAGGSLRFFPLDDPYGSDLRIEDGVPGFASLFGDPLTGLLLAGSRWYDPATTQFTSPDSWFGDSPIEALPRELRDAFAATPGGAARAISALGAYAWCDYDPVNRIDPNGHNWLGVIWSILSAFTWGWHTNSIAVQMEAIAIVWELFQLISFRPAWDTENYWKHSILNMPAPVGSYRQMTGAVLLNGLWRAVVGQDTLWVTGNVIWSRPGDWEALSDERVRELVITSMAPSLLAATSPAATADIFLVRNPKARAKGTSSADGTQVTGLSWDPAGPTAITDGFQVGDDVSVRLETGGNDDIRSVAAVAASELDLSPPLSDGLRGGGVVVTRLDASHLWIGWGGYVQAGTISFVRGNAVHLTRNIEGGDFPTGSGLIYRVREVVLAREPRRTNPSDFPLELNVVRFAATERNTDWSAAQYVRIERGADYFARRLLRVRVSREIVIEPPLDATRGPWVGLEVTGLRAGATVSGSTAVDAVAGPRRQVTLADLRARAAAADAVLRRLDGLKIEHSGDESYRIITGFYLRVTLDALPAALRGAVRMDLLTVDRSTRATGSMDGAGGDRVAVAAGTASRFSAEQLVRVRATGSGGTQGFSRITAIAGDTLTLAEAVTGLAAGAAVEVHPLSRLRTLEATVSSTGDAAVVPSPDGTAVGDGALVYFYAAAAPGSVRAASAPEQLAELDEALPATFTGPLTLQHLTPHDDLLQTNATAPDVRQTLEFSSPPGLVVGDLLHLSAGSRQTFAEVESLDGNDVKLQEPVDTFTSSFLTVARAEFTGVEADGEFAAGTVLVPSDLDVELTRLESFQQHELRHSWQGAVWGPFFLSMPVPYLLHLGFSFSPLANSASKVLRWIPYGMNFIDSLLAGVVWLIGSREGATEVSATVGPDTRSVTIAGDAPADALSHFEPGSNISVENVDGRDALNFIESLDTGTRRATLRFPLDPDLDFDIASVGDTVKLCASPFDKIRRAVNIYAELNLHELWAEHIPVAWGRALAQFMNKEHWTPGLGIYLLPWLIADGDRNRIPTEHDASYVSGFLYNNLAIGEPSEIFVGQFARLMVFIDIPQTSLSEQGRTVSALWVELPAGDDPLTPTALQGLTAEAIAARVDGAVLQSGTRTVHFRESRFIPLKERVENAIGVFFSASHPGTYALKTHNMAPPVVRYGYGVDFLDLNKIRVKALSVTPASGAEVFETDSLEFSIAGDPAAAYSLQPVPDPPAGGVVIGRRYLAPVLPAGPDTVAMTVRIVQTHDPEHRIFHGKGQRDAILLRPEELVTLCQEHGVIVKRLVAPSGLGCCAGGKVEFELPMPPQSFRLASPRPAGASTDARVTWTSARPSKVTFHAVDAVDAVTDLSVVLTMGSHEAVRKELPFTVKVHPRRLIKIHPAIGVARVGNHPTEFFFGPEIPGRPINDEHLSGGAVEPFKSGGQIKRQGARFRVFEYLADGSTRELLPGSGGVREIRWTVHLANKKASWFAFKGKTGESGYPTGHAKRNPSVTSDADRLSKLVIDFGPRSIKRGEATQAFDAASVPSGYHKKGPGALRGSKAINKLGELRTDADGRLIVLGGAGISGTLEGSRENLDGVSSDATNNGWSNNDGWFDDTADGPVTAEVIFDDGHACPVDGAWVLVAPPDFAPQIPSSVSLYDVVYDLAVRHFRITPALFDDPDPNSRSGFKTGYRPSYPAEILPILEAAKLQGWVTQSARFFHDDLTDPALDASARTDIFDRMNDPWSPTDKDSRAMPFLRGDEDLPTLLAPTRVQWFFLKQWKDGNFETTPVAPPSAITPQGLDRAALDNCVGGAFYPGIEAGWVVRQPKIYAEPFRIKHRPLGADLSLGYGSTVGGKFIPDDMDGLGLEPGDFTKRMAMPWQADFHDCAKGGENVPWWPGQRPDDVMLADGSTVRWNAVVGEGRVDMVENWWRLGRVVNRGTAVAPDYIEVERNDAR